MAPGPSYRIRYTILRNRWCENVNRSHKSNGIAIEVDLTFLVLTQVCFDYDCRGFRSQPVPLPVECCTVLSDDPTNKSTDYISNNTPYRTFSTSSRLPTSEIIDMKSHEFSGHILPAKNQLEVDNLENRKSKNELKFVTLHQRCDELYNFSKNERMPAKFQIL